MPVVIGNLKDATIAELYSENTLLRRLRRKDLVSDGCHDCRYARQCRGGLKCLSYALHGDPFIADPGCPLVATASITNGDS
jgi:radical SAM protein with 4Fe4S-binding SPASM domain